MKITLVTTTYNRPFCFSLLEKWIARQTKQPMQWIVVNDSDNDNHERYSYNMNQQIIRRDPNKRRFKRDPITNQFTREFDDPLPSICENWLEAVKSIKGDTVIVAEDDEWYHPEYIATLASLLKDNHLAGVKEDIYFKLKCRKFQKMFNQTHASLSCTGFKKSLVPDIVRCCRVHKSVFIDMYLWAEATDTTREPLLKTVLVPNKASDGRALKIGMKQMPGAAGLGKGHGPDGSSDPTLSVLQSWIGQEDARLYRNIPASAWLTGGI